MLAQMHLLNGDRPSPWHWPVMQKMCEIAISKINTYKGEEASAPTTTSALSHTRHQPTAKATCQFCYWLSVRHGSGSWQTPAMHLGQALPYSLVGLLSTTN